MSAMWACEMEKFYAEGVDAGEPNGSSVGGEWSSIIDGMDGVEDEAWCEANGNGGVVGYKKSSWVGESSVVNYWWRACMDYTLSKGFLYNFILCPLTINLNLTGSMVISWTTSLS